MDEPDPDTCTDAEWDTYLASVDLVSISWGEVEAHRARVERYMERLMRNSAAARANVGRLLDARDDATAAADVLAERCRVLHQAVVDAGTEVLEARRVHGYGSDAEIAALAREGALSEALSVARAELAVANLKAIQALLDAQ